MKKIINGKRYDTETATSIGWYSNNLSYNDLDYKEETLYKKRTGEYFLCGEGGARSDYARYTDDGHWAHGEEIRPISWEGARQWAEKHLSAEAYEAEFGEIQEDESRVTVPISISAGTLARAKRAASQSGISLSAYIESKL